MLESIRKNKKEEVVFGFSILYFHIVLFVLQYLRLFLLYLSVVYAFLFILELCREKHRKNKNLDKKVVNLSVCCRNIK